MEQQKEGRTLVCGDIHGGYKALMQVLERSSFDYKLDTLICLGDVADGWSETPQCIEELLKIKKLIYIWGNHDWWLDDWFKTGASPIIWTEQGGRATMQAYVRDNNNTPEGKKPLMVKHRKFFDKAKFFHIDKEANLFVHGGVEPGFHPRTHDKEFLMWDRTLFEAQRWNPEFIEQYKNIYIGHTSTEKFSKHPIRYGNVWCLDQGAGWGGYLTLMDVETNKFYQSDRVKDMYPNELGR